MLKHHLQVVLAIALGFLPASVALAIAGVPPVSPPTSISTVNEVIALVCAFLNIVFTVVIILSIVVLLGAAFMFLTSQGDESRIETARHWLTYAVVGIVVALLARGIVLIMGNFIGAAGSGATPVC